ncbi:MAG: hypothetical protein AB1791_05795 [Chloroflexota bacterium]
MERVAFLMEETNERLRCLLNPETLVIRRTAGVRSHPAISGQLTRTGLAEDPLLYTGGGRTELQLDLLFDVALAGSSITTEDVRELTAPLWRLAENTADASGQRRPPQVRFLWGKAWDIPAVVVAVAEQFEQFLPSGIPQRSWLRLRLWRVDEAAEPSAVGGQPPLVSDQLAVVSETISLAETLPEELPAPAEDWSVHEVVGGGAATETAETEAAAVGERLDQLAYDYYGDAALWRLLAVANDLADPLRLAAGTLLRIPPLTVLGGRP